MLPGVTVLTPLGGRGAYSLHGGGNPPRPVLLFAKGIVMAQQLVQNFTAALTERAPDLAAATDAGAVRTIVQEAETEARLRTEVPDTFVYRVTVLVLGLAVLSVIVAQLWLTLQHDDIPDGIIAIGSAAIGALAGLLAPTPAS